MTSATLSYSQDHSQPTYSRDRRSHGNLSDMSNVEDLNAAPHRASMTLLQAADKLSQLRISSDDPLSPPTGYGRSHQRQPSSIGSMEGNAVSDDAFSSSGQVNGHSSNGSFKVNANVEHTNPYLTGRSRAEDFSNHRETGRDRKPRSFRRQTIYDPVCNEFRKYPRVGKIARELIQERRAEANQVNKQLLLRLTNPWSEVQARDLIMTYLARDGRRSVPAYYLDPNYNPKAAWETRPGSNARASAAPHTSDPRGDEERWFERLSAPRQEPEFDPYPEGFVPHPRRRTGRSRAISSERLTALARPKQRPIVDDPPGLEQRQPKALDPLTWERLSKPRMKVLRRLGAQEMLRESQRRPSSGKEQVYNDTQPQSASRHSRTKAPKTSVMVGRYSRASSHSQESSTSKLADLDDQADAELAASAEPPLASPAYEAFVVQKPSTPQRYDSIVEEDEVNGESTGATAAPSFPIRRSVGSTHSPSSKRSFTDTPFNHHHHQGPILTDRMYESVSDFDFSDTHSNRSHAND
ncbi:hypothetical protein DFS34DRAFT_23621 [Phlyctochytrium arcticum]|nr:hypothetical protein DFS34DRAFT_23621 [Phlyctochytrium arcticum]